MCPRRSSQSRGTRGGRVTVALGVVLVALNLRPAVTAVSPLLADVRADLGMSATAAGLLGTVPTVAFAAFGAAAPALARRWGLERTAWAAMLLTTAGLLLRAVAPGTVSFLARSLLALGGMGVGNVVLPPLVKRYFPDRVGAVTGLYAMLLAAGTALPPLLAVPVADLAGWRASVATWSLLSLAAAVPWLVTAHRARRDTAGLPAAPHVPAGALLRSPVAWGLAGLLGMTSLNTYAMFAWLPTLLLDAGLTAAEGGTMLALFAAVGMPMSLLVPWLTFRMRNPFWLVLTFLLAYAVGYLGLLLRPADLTWLWVVAAGAGPGAFPMALAMVNLRSRTTQGSAALSGFAQGVGYTVAGAGPFVVGWLRDATGGWGAAFGFLAATLVVQVLAGWVISRPRAVEDDLPAPAVVVPATTLDR
ncbi:CynX/NimT family MFS transporter [Quadrisphaera sp. GCM10027208]|uniref:CynX/NimT family MFS transporter n=1 Tax=Quadrisphaera sp. GCM10027208 TaxID=3273423 RepID=UPI00362161E6